MRFKVCIAVFTIGLVTGVALSPADAAPIAQETYASAEDAASALAAAAKSQKNAALDAVLGPNGQKLVSSGDRVADADAQQRFAAAYEEKHVLTPDGPDKFELSVGNNDWTLPIPIVRKGGRWSFDTAAGAQQIIDRRIGRDELRAIRVLLTYVEAQKDYFDRAKQQTGTGAYAERLISTPGHEDGLYWPDTTGGAESPLAPLVAQAASEGYPTDFGVARMKPEPYQGYYFRVLKAQGDDAPGGAKNYVESGHMTAGFALIAWPASYRSSGVMTFLVGPDGVVFQKDLGPDTERLASGTTRFDPDLSWTRVEVTNQ